MISERRQKHIPKQASFSSLPDELIENILARFSRYYYPWLSLVSKKFLSLLSSTEIYKTRHQIGTQETCLYVCLQLPNHPCPKWFSLWSKPNQTRTKRTRKLRFKKYLSGNMLVPIPPSSSHSPPIPIYSTVSVGSEIYVIGSGSPDYEELSSSVRILDCRSHTWRDGPNMTVARNDPSTVVLNEKIYVIGGCGYFNYKSVNCFEVFDIKSQSWTALRICDELCNEVLLDILGIVNVVEEKIYVSTYKEKEFIYEAKQGTWKSANKLEYRFEMIEKFCMIENEMYGISVTKIFMWYDSNGREWKKIKGLKELGKHHSRGLIEGHAALDIVNYGGNLLVVWDTTCKSSRENKIWYAEISLERRCNGSEVWGNVEWVDAMITVSHDQYKFLHCLPVFV